MNNEILTRNFYQLFDLPVAFEIDMNQLQQHFRTLAQTLHPDKYANASDQERRISMQQTSWVNKGYQTLKDPIARASYLLTLKGIDADLENETTMDMEFLMHQMELRETLENVRSHADPLALLDKELKGVKNSMQTMSEAFSAAYAVDKLDDAKECLRKMQFIQKARNEINALTAKIEDELF